jgi:3-hydroxyanthranilate 3,4-dioxygenase
VGEEDLVSELSAVNLSAVMDAVRGAPKPVNILWQQPDTIAFVARGREHRSEFHIDPSDEVMYMLKGKMDLHYLTPEGEHKVAVLNEGDIIHCPAGTPHSPRFAPDAFLLVLERKRKTDEQDRFLWFCENCNTKLYETSKHVPDYREDPVSRVYEEFYSDRSRLTCPNCGHEVPHP